MIIIVKTAWLSSVRTMAPKRDNNHYMKDWDIKYLNKKRYLKNCNLCIYKNVEIQDRRKEISNAWGKI